MGHARCTQQIFEWAKMPLCQSVYPEEGSSGITTGSTSSGIIRSSYTGITFPVDIPEEGFYWKIFFKKN